jgi:DNA-binding CsgD family transcriptional regulator
MGKALQGKVLRVPLKQPFTTMEKLVVALVERENDYPTIAKRLGIRPTTAKYHALNASRKIHGNLPVSCKIIFWVRGTTLEQLTGGRFVQAPSKATMSEAEEVPLY